MQVKYNRFNKNKILLQNCFLQYIQKVLDNQLKIKVVIRVKDILMKVNHKKFKYQKLDKLCKDKKVNKIYRSFLECF